MLTVVSGARTDVGLKRTVNEDAILEGPPAWVVADGMGGHAAGDVASRIIVDTLRDVTASFEGVIRPPDVQDALERANEAILAHERIHPGTRGMGSTVAGIVLTSVGDSAHWAIFNVGDSRVYRCFGGTMSRATVDHSEIEELVLAGSITEDEARVHAGRNVLTRSMGSDPAPQVDMWVLPQTPGERFVICSDGLTTELSDAEIAEVVLGDASPAAAVDRLLELTLAAGARDNTSVIVVDVCGDGGSDLDEETQPRIVLRSSDGND